MDLKSAFCAATFALAVGACTSPMRGFLDNASDPDQEHPGPDAVAPYVVEVNPSPDTPIQYFSGEIRVTFSEPMASDSLPTSLISSPSGEKPADASLSDDGTVLTVTPEGVLLPDTLTLVLANLTDLAGNELETTFFTWTIPAWLKLPHLPTGGSAWQTRVDSKGRIVVAYLQGSGQLAVARLTGDSWEQLGGTLVDDPAVASARPRLELDRDDEPIALVRLSSRAELVAKRWNGTSWQQLPGSIVAPLGRHLRDLAFTLDSQGRAIAAYLDDAAPSSPCGQLRVARYENGGWAALGGIIQHGDPWCRPVALTVVDDEPVMAWHEFPDSTTNLVIGRWTGTEWAYSDGPELGFATDLDVLTTDADGRLLFAYTQTGLDGTTSGVFREIAGVWHKLGTGSDSPILGQDTSLRGGQAMDRTLLCTEDGTLLVSFVALDTGETQLVRLDEATNAWLPLVTVDNANGSAVPLTPTSEGRFLISRPNNPPGSGYLFEEFNGAPID